MGSALRFEMTNQIGKRIRLAREAKGWSQTDLARAAGTKQQNVHRVETGETKHSRSIAPMMKALGLSDREARPSLARETEKLAQDPTLSHEIPIYAANRIENGSTQITTIMVGLEQRTNALIGVPNAYGLRMPGPSMTPIFRSGELLLCHPFRPISPGDRAVFRSESSSDIVIAELKDEMSSVWKVKTCQNEFALEKSKYPSAHLIVAALKS